MKAKICMKQFTFFERLKFALGFVLGIDIIIHQVNIVNLPTTLEKV